MEHRDLNWSQLERRAAAGQRSRPRAVACSGLRPGLRRLGVLADATDPSTPALMQRVEQAAIQLGLQLLIERVSAPSQYQAVFRSWQRQSVDALFLQPSLAQRPAIELALHSGLPSCSFTRGFVEAGGLIAYAPDVRETAHMVADQADRILRGALPAQLPVQQNARFELVINLRTAALLRLRVAPALLARLASFTGGGNARSEINLSCASPR